MKYLLTLILTIFIFAFNTSISKADSVVLQNEMITGKIKYVLFGVIEITTKDGDKKILRSPNGSQIRDIIEVGFLRKKKISGEVTYLDDDFIEILTATSRLHINRIWVKNILLSGKDESDI